MKKDIRAFGYDEMKAEVEEMGEKAFRAGQIYEWLHVKLADSFDEMTNLSKKLRERLKEEYVILPVEMLERQVSRLDGTNKFLFRLYDGNVVESVLMRYKHGNSVCISSQAGCRMGCAFCASTIGGLQRNLSASEMLGQVYQIQKITGERVSNVVVMGTGEPLDNYDNFVKFIRLLTDEHRAEHQPAECNSIHLRDRARHTEAGGRGSPDHACPVPARLHPGEAQEAHAGGEQV